VTTADAFPGFAPTPVGAPGTDQVVTDADAVDAGPVPRLFVAVTVNVYAVPAVRPVTVAVVTPVAAAAVLPPGDDVTVYPETDGDAVTPVHETDTVVLPVTVARTPVGAVGRDILVRSYIHTVDNSLENISSKNNATTLHGQYYGGGALPHRRDYTCDQY